ncbi:MAG: hypothetical protein NZL96_03895 [Patescibacteria group bacterium]|nr:hypothetical protein [Patescibacteria group bacterium]
MEILIIITLIVLVSIVTLITLNPGKQIEKTQDSRRKSDLSKLQKNLEDWYGDKNRYPLLQEICYQIVSETTCYICGSDPNSPKALSSYVNTLPCDPQHPTKKYLYRVDNPSFPTTYWIYVKLSNLKDPLIAEMGCLSGCGPEGDKNYQIVFASPNAEVDQPIYCRNVNAIYVVSNNYCNICGNYSQCLQNHPDKDFYIDTQCQKICIKN